MLLGLTRAEQGCQDESQRIQVHGEAVLPGAHLIHRGASWYNTGLLSECREEK